MRTKNVTLKVVEDVKKYFDEKLPQYTVIDIVDYSYHPDDNYLFMVKAKKMKDNSYAVWTNWNQQSKSLNYGHYDIETNEEADRILRMYYKGKK